MQRTEHSPRTRYRDTRQRVTHELSTLLVILSQFLGSGAVAAFPLYISGTPRQSEGTTIYLPLIFSPDVIGGTSDDIREAPYCSPVFPEITGYTLNEQEQAIEELLLHDIHQEHPNLEFSIALSQAARRKAEDMAARAYFDHTNPDGYGPNCLVLQHQFVLPDHYDFSSTGNNIETIIAGMADPTAAWELLLGSEAHADHLLGRNDFYAEQRYYGIGYVRVPGSEYEYYLVILISDSEEA